MKREYDGARCNKKKKKKEKSSRRPSHFPLPWYFYLACLRRWRCILVLSQPTFDIKTASSAMQSCLSSRVILSALTSWYQLQDVTFVFPDILAMPTLFPRSRKGCWEITTFRSSLQIQNLEVELHASPEAMKIIVYFARYWMKVFMRWRDNVNLLKAPNEAMLMLGFYSLLPFGR